MIDRRQFLLSSGAAAVAGCDSGYVDVLRTGGTCIADQPGAVRAKAADAFVDSLGLRIGPAMMTADLMGRVPEVRARHVRLRPELGAATIAPFARATDTRALLIWEDVTSLIALCDELGPIVGAAGLWDTGSTDMESWAASLRQRMSQLHDGVRADPRLRETLIVGPNLGSADRVAAAGDLSADVDVGTLVPWAPGLLTAPPGARAADTLARHVPAYPGRSFIVPQVGYSSKSGPDSVTEVVQSKYLVRMLFEHFNLGVLRTYVADLADDPGLLDAFNGGLGLVRSDGSTKLSFEALARTMTLLADPGPIFQPGTLAFTVENSAPEVHHLLLQRRNGAFFLAVWLEIESSDIEVRRSVTVRLARQVERIALYRIGQSLNPERWELNTNQLVMDVTDEVALLEIQTGC